MATPDAWSTAAVFGLDVSLTLVGLLVAAAVLVWGFERYRRTFSKTEFGIALLIALGLLSVTVLPDAFVFLADLLNVSETFRAVQLTANVVFVFLLLYVISMINDNRATVTRLTRSLTVQQASPAEEDSAASLYVVIPAYNESGTIAGVLDSLPETVEGHTVRAVVVSDGSDDRTTRAASEHDAIVVEHPINQGQGGALRTGFEIARRNGAEIVVTMDADGQHPADQLPDLVEPIVNDEADYVLGSRYRGEDASGNSLARRGGIRAFTWLINAMAKTDITDCTNGFRAIRGSRLGDLTLTEERFSAPELIIEARKNGLRIAEVPVTIRERGAGETKKPGLGYAVGLARTILVTWIR
ncbi:MAG: glycosyltransferase family 2 protein [Halobacteriales archaeon]